MKHRSHTWALVLAGGEGNRLEGLTRNVHGVVVPKQFCLLSGGPSLLQEALQRVATVASMQQVCTVVAAQHRHWWTAMLSCLSPGNVIVQPHNRGTAHGILLPLLRISERDPDATLLIVPADHHLRDEDRMRDALREASRLAHADSGRLYLLGIEPENGDPDLGYILPTSRVRGEATGVLRFIEKPSEAQADQLVAQGALWNSFIVAGSARTLLKLFENTFDSAITAMRTLDGIQLGMAYRHLRNVDFSRDVLSGHEALLRVLTVSHCGWTDLGTARRVGQTLKRLIADDCLPTVRPFFPSHLNLSDQMARLQQASVNVHA